MRFNPATVANLLRLTMGGLHHGNRTLVLHSRLRYFDADRRRPGLPLDVAALVEQLDAERAVVTLVNLSPLHPRRVMVQAGSYGEHQITTATGDGQALPASRNLPGPWGRRPDRVGHETLRPSTNAGLAVVTPGAKPR
jgi:hypothetical protein